MSNRSSVYFYLVTSLMVFVYLLIRAFTVDITFDEVWTMNDFVPKSYLHILNFTPPNTNNHILNTILIKFLVSLFGDSLIVIRLPNLLSGLIFLFFSVRIVTTFLTRRTAMISFLLLILNPFLLDFFGLARGYGLALGFEMVSIYYLLYFFTKSNSARHLIVALTFSGLAVLANFSLLNFYLGVVAVVMLHVIKLKEHRSKNILCLIIVSFILTLITWEPLRKIIQEHKLDYGGSEGFYADTLVSLAKFFAYSHFASNSILLVLNIFLLLFTGIIIASSFQKTFWLEKKYTIHCLLLVSCISAILQHYLIGNLLIIDRTALFLFPLVILSLAFSLDLLNIKWLQLVVAVPLLILFFTNFCLHANFNRTASWYFCAHHTEILQKINAEGERSNKKIRIDFSWPLSLVLRYHCNHEAYPFIQTNNDWFSQHNEPFDYYIYANGRIDRNAYTPEKEIIHTMQKDTFLVYEDADLYVFRNFKPPVN